MLTTTAKRRGSICTQDGILDFSLNDAFWSSTKNLNSAVDAQLVIMAF